MVVVWNDLSRGNGNRSRINCLKQYFSSIALQRLRLLFITILPPYFGYTGFEVNISMGQIAESVGIYLGIRLHSESLADMH
jgi:ACR3 family arsenite transporter